MRNELTDQARRVMSLAADEARRFNHGYVGTEHVLLGLLLEGSCDAGGVLARLGLNADNVRAEIEKIVHRGTEPVSVAGTPLTPRAKRVIELASEEAACLSVSEVAPEHLLIGLIRELGGVAGQVMRNLGLEPDRVRAEAMRIRLMQARIVERAVRPIRAGIAYKRKIREELLAHLTAIYQEELVSAHDPLVAMESAARRFGDPMELSRELQASVPVAARRDYFVQRWVGWRPPESVGRMMARTSTMTFVIILVLTCILMLAGLIVQGWDRSQGVALRSLLAMALLTPAAQFALGLCYYKIRDSLWGVFGSRRSLLNAVLWSIAGALSISATMGGFMVIVENTTSQLIDQLPVAGAIAVVTSITLLLLARTRGVIEIRDTVWSTMDLGVTS